MPSGLSKKEQDMQNNPLWLRAKLEEVTKERNDLKQDLIQTNSKLAAATASLQEAASMMQEAAKAEVESIDDTSVLQAEVPLPYSI
jgi:uncharacterized protein YlxW (UPF0749 family)